MKYNSLFNPGNKVLTQLQKSSIDLTLKTLKRDNLELFEVVLGYHIKTLYLCIENLASDILQNKLNDLLGLYLSLLDPSISNEKTNRTKNMYCTRLSSILSELIQRIGYKYDTEHNAPKNQRLNQLYFQCYFTFTRLLYSIIMHSDWDNFKEAFGNLNNSDPSQLLHYQTEEQELFNKVPKTDKDKEEIIQFNHVKRLPLEYWLNARLGVLYWSFFLYEKSVQMPDKVIAFIDEERIKGVVSLYDSYSSYSGILSLLDNLVNVTQQDGYFGMDLWDYRKRESGQAWYSRGISYWFTRGYALDLIRSNLNPMQGNHIDLSKQTNLLKTLRNELKQIETDSSIWEKTLGMTKEQIQSRVEELTKMLSESIHNISIEGYKIIAESDLDSNRIEDIRIVTYDIWKKKALIYNLFKWFKCRYKILPKPENPESISFGNRIFYRDLKEQLIAVSPRGFPRLEFSEFGEALPKYDEQLFYMEVLKYQERMRNSENIIKALDDGIKEIMDRYTPTVIIMHSHLFNNNDLFGSPKFIPNWKIKEKITEEIRYSTYRDIKLFMTYDRAMENKIFIGSLADAFMINKTDGYYDETVSLDFTTIERKEAEEIYRKNPDKWNVIDTGLPMSEDVMVYRIMNSVYVDLWLHHRYMLKDTNAFVVYELTV